MTAAMPMKKYRQRHSLCVLLVRGEKSVGEFYVYVVALQSPGPGPLASTWLWELPLAELEGAASETRHADAWSCSADVHVDDRQDESDTLSHIIKEDLKHLGWTVPSTAKAVETLWNAVWGVSWPEAGPSGSAGSFAPPPSTEVVGRGSRRWKLMEEPPFGPGPPQRIAALVIPVDSKSAPHGSIVASQASPSQRSGWLSLAEARSLMYSEDASSHRIGPNVFQVLWSHANLHHGCQATSKPSPSLPALMEYPPGLSIIPLGSATAPPFTKTNILMFGASLNASQSQGSADVDSAEVANAESGAAEVVATDMAGAEVAASGECLLVDPGCSAGSAWKDLEKVLEQRTHGKRSVVVFLTHHHHDHVAAILAVARVLGTRGTVAAHPATLARVRESETVPMTRLELEGGEKLSLGGETFLAIHAPGHTDGHMALFHLSTKSLVVGDHCVGEGSTLLDASAGGDMDDYLETTEAMIQLQPRVLIPMHGRPCFWPLEMLQGYRIHRLMREAKVKKALESGARTQYQLLVHAYADTPRVLWPWALTNALLHVKRLQRRGELPEGAKVDGILGGSLWWSQASCIIEELIREAYARKEVLATAGLITLGTVVGAAIWVRRSRAAS